MTGTGLLAAVALTLGGHASAAPSRLYEESRGEAGTVVRVYSEGGEVYSATIEAPGKPTVRVPPRGSTPPPRLHWISPDLFRIDYGSELGADVASLFYSAARNATDGPYEFVKAVDPVGERVLCTGVDVVARQLFGGVGTFLVKPEDMNRSAMKWFVVSSESRFEGDHLYIKYLLEPARRGEQTWVTRVIELPHARRSNGPGGRPRPRVIRGTKMNGSSDDG